MTEEKKESEKSTTAGKKYTGGPIPKATKAAKEELEEATKESE